MPAGVAAQSVVEGVLLRGTATTPFAADPPGRGRIGHDRPRNRVDRRSRARRPARACLQRRHPARRDLANTPHGHLTATGLAELATARPRQGTHGGGVRQGAAPRTRVRRPARRQRRQHRAAADDQAHVHPCRSADEAARRWSARASCTTPAAWPQAQRRSPRPDEERHVRRGRRVRGDARARRGRLRHGRHRLPDVHRQHAVGHGDGTRGRDHDPRRHDGRGDQHRRRGPARDGRRAGAGDRGRRRCDRRHRHAHRRVHARARHAGRRRDRQRRRTG